MVNRILVLLAALLLSSFGLLAQIGGTRAYTSLDFSPTPRSAALGGKVVALDDSDQGVSMFNPAHLSSDLDGLFSLSYVSYFADINYSFINYAKDFGKLGTFGVGMQYVGYGDFIEADLTGNITGKFTGNDVAFYVSYAKSIDSLFSIGINLKSLYSHLERYTSFGMAIDVGATYNSRDGLFSAGVVVRNIGSMLKPYTRNTWEPLPFEVLLGASHKLKHAPFRFVVTFQQLQTYQLHYERVAEGSSLFGDQEQSKNPLINTIGNEFLSHLILGVEFVPIKSLYIRGGYNFQRRHEMKVTEKVASVGLSWGVGIKIKKFEFNYSRAIYHLAGGSNHFSISTNINDFFVKKNL